MNFSEDDLKCLAIMPLILSIRFDIISVFNRCLENMGGLLLEVHSGIQEEKKKKRKRAAMVFPIKLCVRNNRNGLS